MPATTMEPPRQPDEQLLPAISPIDKVLLPPEKALQAIDDVDQMRVVPH